MFFVGSSFDLGIPKYRAGQPDKFFYPNALGGFGVNLVRYRQFNLTFRNLKGASS